MMFPWFLPLLSMLLLFYDNALPAVYKTAVRRLDSPRGTVELRLKGRMAAKAYHEAKRMSRIYQQQQKSEQDNNHNTYRQVVYDYYDLEYIGIMSIGTPPQEFEMVLDTGSADLWMPDSSCDYRQSCYTWCLFPMYCELNCDEYCCDGSASNVSTCDKKNKFHSSKSLTYVKHGRTFQILYGTGFVDGFLGMDTVRFGGANDPAALTIPNTFIGQATAMGKFFRDNPMDGICGLAFTSIAAGGVPPPLMNALEQGMLDKPMFTVFLETEGVGAENKKGGVFTWGGVDDENCGPVVGWAPLTHATYYEFEIQGVSYGGEYMTNRRERVISDTGTSLIIGPRGTVESLAQAIGGMEWDVEDELFLLPCDYEYNPVTMFINGRPYALPREVLSINAGDPRQPNLCVFAMVPYESWGFGPDWILGDPFIRQYCNIHDIGKKRMGFALAKQPLLQRK